MPIFRSFLIFSLIAFTGLSSFEAALAADVHQAKGKSRWEILLNLNVELYPGGEVIEIPNLDANLERISPTSLRFLPVKPLILQMGNVQTGELEPALVLHHFDLDVGEAKADSVIRMAAQDELDVVTFSPVQTLYSHFVERFGAGGHEHFLGPGFLDLPAVFRLEYLALDLKLSDFNQAGVHKPVDIRFGGRRLVSRDGMVMPEVLEIGPNFASRLPITEPVIQEILNHTEIVLAQLKALIEKPSAQILEFKPRPKKCEEDLGN